MKSKKKCLVMLIIIFLSFTMNVYAQLPEKAMSSILTSKKSRELYEIKALKISEVWKYQFLPDIKTGVFDNYYEACGIKYNPSADVIEEIFTQYDYEIKGYVTIKKVLYSYENNGVISARQVYCYDGIKKSLVLTEHETYTTDSKQNIIEKKAYTGSDLQKSFRYNYDQNSNMIECVEYNAHGDPVCKTLNLYDKSGLKYKTGVYREPDSIIKAAIDYDSKENEILVLNFDGRGTLLNSVENIFDVSENITESKMMIGRAIVSHTFYKYDEFKNITEKNVMTSDGSLLSKNIYKYDDKLNLIEEAAYAVKIDPETKKSSFVLAETLKHSYNEMNKRSQTLAAGPDGKIIAKTTHGYKKSE